MCRSLSGVAPTISWVLCPAGANAGAWRYFASSCLALAGRSRICAMGRRMACFALVRGQRLQALLGGQLDVNAEPVGQQPQPLHQLRRRAGDGLGVDIPVEAVLLPQDPQALDHPLGGVVRAAQHAGGEEQPLDIVAAVEADGQLRQLLGREGGPAAYRCCGG